MPTSHEHHQNGSNGAAAVPEDHEVTRATAELAHIELAYDRALRRGCTADSRAEIAAAFDEADRLQGRMLRTLHRLRALQREDVGDPGASDAAVTNGAGRTREVDPPPRAQTITHA